MSYIIKELGQGYWVWIWNDKYLPNEGDPVIVRLDDGEMLVAYYRKGKWYKNNCYAKDIEILDIHCWTKMPLPPDILSLTSALYDSFIEEYGDGEEEDEKEAESADIKEMTRYMIGDVAWYARDEDGVVMCFTDIPIKDEEKGMWVSTKYCYPYLGYRSLSFLKWEDERPYEMVLE